MPTNENQETTPRWQPGPHPFGVVPTCPWAGVEMLGWAAALSSNDSETKRAAPQLHRSAHAHVGTTPDVRHGLDLTRR
jgi:hypothetical protein